MERTKVWANEYCLPENKRKRIEYSEAAVMRLLGYKTTDISELCDRKFKLRYSFKDTGGETLETIIGTVRSIILSKNSGMWHLYVYSDALDGEGSEKGYLSYRKDEGWTYTTYNTWGKNLSEQEESHRGELTIY